MNLSKVDLNLFIVFDAIYTEANLTRAGQIVGITQPAVSNALARLRETFNDPLFVRTAQGMVPTPMAQNIITPVRNALQLLRVSVQESRSFVPEQATKTYRISMTDLSRWCGDYTRLVRSMPNTPALVGQGAAAVAAGVAAANHDHVMLHHSPFFLSELRTHPVGSRHVGPPACRRCRCCWRGRGSPPAGAASWASGRCPCRGT